MPAESDWILHYKELGLSYMQARYYDPVIGRFYSNDPVDVIGHITRGNPVHGFNRYTYANNNPYKYVDPDGEFAIFGAILGAGADFGMQMVSAMGSGQSFGEALDNVDYGSVAISGALGAVGAHGAKMLGGGVSGSMKVAKETVKVEGKAARIAVGTDGAVKVGTVGAIKAGQDGENIAIGAGKEVVDTLSPIPVADKIEEGVKELFTPEEKDNSGQ
ncbi:MULTISPECIES: RHS repeat-associated core domain-containing protein [unclassified Pseudoalteromonas]|uniref:RHS repeat-associated core domain-containing protein n=1 Tax=unclassified Pseudoalteromonas TaxID=194690 RepID=UPI00301450E7